MQYSFIVGSWTLESYLKRGEGGHVEYPMGKAPFGQILYSADGRMSVQIMAAERSLPASSQLHEISDEERGQAARTYFAYSGLYELEWSHTPYCHVLHGRVTHHMESSLFPHWVGRSLVRSLTLEGDRLELSTCQAGWYRGRLMTTHLVWRRNRPDPAQLYARLRQFERIEA